MGDTEIGGMQRAFQSTLWTCVLRAKDPSAPDRRAALERLIQAYWKPAYSFLRRKGYDAEISKDFTQGFFAAFLERDFLKYVERGRGKFRTFLLTALEHFVADEHDRAKAQKRGGGRAGFSLDFVQAEREIGGSDETPDKIFRRQWALLVLERALGALRATYEAEGRKDEFEVLRLHLGIGGAPSYADVAKRLGLSESDVRNRLHRVRGMYREKILEEVRAYTENEAEAQEEIRDLFSALS